MIIQTIRANPQMKEAYLAHLHQRRAEILEKLAIAPSNESMLRLQGGAQILGALIEEVAA